MSLGTVIIAQRVCPIAPVCPAISSAPRINFMASKISDKIVSFFNYGRRRRELLLIKKKLPTKKVLFFIDRRPFVSFFITLGALLLLIVLGNFLGNLSKKDEAKQILVKDAKIYSIGSSPKVSLSGQVEKSGVFKITAQTPAIVSRINLHEGDKVGKGQSIITLSSNYQGGNIPGLQAALAQKQYKNILDTYSTQKSLIDDQRSIADQSSVSNDKLRDISKQNLNDTNSLIDLNQNILDTLNNQLNTLEANNVGGVNDAQILQTKQLIAQMAGGLAQLRASSRGLGFQTDSANPPTKLSDLQKNITLKQLDLQSKALDLNRDLSRIQAAIAGVSASFMNPTTPYSGIIDRIYVKVGDSVNPGTVLALVSGNNKESNVIVRVPYEIVTKISRTDTSTIHFDNSSYDAVPLYVSEEATDGQLYTVIYSVPADSQNEITNGTYVTVDIPVGYADTSSEIPFIPLDAVYQTQNEAYVLVENNKKAEGRRVTLGTVYGRFAQVTSGLNNRDKVILNRNIIAGDSITTDY